MKQKIILLFALSYAITDEGSGEIKKGISCSYYFNTELKPVSNDNGTIGTRPAKGSAPIGCLDKIKTAPAIYEASFDMKIGSDGKPVLTIIDLDYVEDISIVPSSSVAPSEQKKEKAG